LFALAAILEAIFLRLALLGDLRQHVTEAIGLLLLAGLFYLVCTFLVLRRRSPVSAALVVGAAIVFRLTLWPLYPALSDDVFRYRWEGKLQAAGGNPYEVRPNDAAWNSLRDETFTSVPGRDFRAVYGPLMEEIEWMTYRVVSRFVARPFAQAFWFKVPSALFDLGAMAALWLLLKRKRIPTERILIYAWSPLPLIEFSGTGHNDSIVIFFVLLALLAIHVGQVPDLPSGDSNGSKRACREPAPRSMLGAFTALGLAAVSKIWPAILFPIFIAWRPRRSLWCLVSLPILALATLPYFTSTVRWAGIDENFRYTSGFLGGWRNNDSLFGVLLWAAGNDFYLAKKLAFAVVCVTIAVVIALRWPPERGALAVIAVLLMVSANCHAWYLTWMLPLLVLYPVPPLLLWVALAPLAHTAVIRWIAAGEWNGSTSVRYYEYVPVYVGLAIWLVYARSRTTSEPPGQPL
jgi:alpha-1,6-mannosyltransferase